MTREIQESPPLGTSDFAKERSGRWIVHVVTVLGFALPLVAYLWLIHEYGVNSIWQDQWDDVNVIAHPSLGNLWALHNDNRIFFPNLIVLVLAHASHFNILVEDYLSGIMLVLAIVLLIFAHKRRSPSTPWLYYWPVAIIMLSFVQVGNTLWGFQMAWYLVLLTLAGALLLLDEPMLTWLSLTGAMTLAIVGSFSSLQGLLIWPAGLVLLYCRSRPSRFVIAWLAGGIVTGAAYFYQFRPTGPASNDSYVLSHPVLTIQFFLSAIGDIVGESLPTVGRNNAVIVLGVVVVAVAICVVLLYGSRGNESGSPIGVALICFGLLFAATITAGRTSYGLYVAGVSRYTTFDLLILVGCYLAILDRRTEPRTVVHQKGAHSQFAFAGDRSSVVPPTLRKWKTNQWNDKPLLVLRVIVMSTIVILVILGTRNGLSGAAGWRQTLSDSADVTVNVQKVPDGVVASVLYSFRGTAFTRQMAQIAKTRDLSVFATGAARRYAREGLSVESRPVTRMVSPTNGATLKGNGAVDCKCRGQHRLVWVQREQGRVCGYRRRPSRREDRLSEKHLLRLAVRLEHDHCSQRIVYVEERCLQF